MQLNIGKKHAWRNGYHAKVDADTAFKECERIRMNYGGELKPQRIVDEAADDLSPIHGVFEWDDEVAANEHRVNQARAMMAAIVVVETKNEYEKPSTHRVYEVQQVERLQGQRTENVYRSVEDILADPEAREQLLRRARGELRAFRKRYERLRELSQVIDAIDELDTAAV